MAIFDYDKLKNYVQKREMQRTGGHPESASFHSKGYHRYFQGWSEYRVELPNGKSKIERIYTGVYHTAVQNPSQRIWSKTSYLMLWVISLLLFLWGAIGTAGSNSAVYVAIPQAAAILGLFWLLCSIASYCVSPKNMTLYEYRCVTNLLRAGKYAPIAMLAVAAASLLYYLIHMGTVIEDGLWAGAAACILGPLISALASYMIYLMEQNVKYDSFLSDAKPPLDAIQINVKD